MHKKTPFVLYGAYVLFMLFVFFIYTGVPHIFSISEAVRFVKQ
jgi:hypothetical protein